MKQLDYLFTSTKGLILVAIALVSLVTAIFGTLSGPMVEWGVKEITVNLLNMELNPAERAGRIVILYHSIAMAVVAVEVYMITSIVPMKKTQQRNINLLITIGYLLALIFGLGFGYWGQNWAFHGLFITGLVLVFFSGVMLAVALNPWNRRYRVSSFEYAHTKGGMDLERMAFFVMTIAMLVSAGFGAVPGSYWGNGFETFLAEDLIREPHKGAFQKSIIGHLHIMLTLIAVAITLVVGRWLDFKGIFHKIAMWLMIPGTIIISVGAWSVVWTHHAHTIIYGGSVMVMLAALFLVIFGWKKLIRERIEEKGLKKPGFFSKLKALLHDPLKFGSLWQMVFMNFTVSGVGIFMAVKLDEIFRVWPAREERISLTGHWHILAAIIATIIILYYADISGLKGKVRKWFGWTLIIGSDIAFAAVTVFSMKRLFMGETAQQDTVDLSMILTDLGLGVILVMMLIFLLWRLFDLTKSSGLWRTEYNRPELEVRRTTEILSNEEDSSDQRKGGEK